MNCISDGNFSRTYQACALWIIAINLAVCICRIIATQFGWAAEFMFLAVVPSKVSLAFSTLEPFQICAVILTSFTYLFLSGNYSYLVTDMFILFLVGKTVEKRLGTQLFLLSYFGAGMAAVIPHVLSDITSTKPLIGSGAAVAGVLMIYTWLSLTDKPSRVLTAFNKMMLCLFIGLLLGLNLHGACGLSQTASDIAHWALLGGFSAGAGISFLISRIDIDNRKLPPRPRF